MIKVFVDGDYIDLTNEEYKEQFREEIEQIIQLPSIEEQVEANSQAIESIMNFLAGGELNV